MSDGANKLRTGAAANYQRWFTADEFRARHERVYDAIGPGAVAVVQGAAPVGGFEIFRQSNEFFYLSGVEVPQALLMLDGRTRASTLYLPHRDDKHAASEGAELAAEDADVLARLTGFDEVAGVERLETDLRDATVVYTPHAPAEGNMACQDTLRHAAKLIAGDPWGNQPPREAFFASLLRQRLPNVEVRDLSPLLNDLRLIKSAKELKVMRRAGELTVLAVNEAMRATRPGVYEYQLGAVGEYVYRVNGSRGAGYRPIIATGENIWFLHYYRNTSILKDGDWVLMDVAPDVANYTSDIGRFWPVNGRYSDLQRQLYGFLVDVHKTYLRHLGPGLLPSEVNRRVSADLEAVVSRIKWRNADHERGARKLVASPNGLTHPVGMAVHDVGQYKERPLSPGVVFALDPQMWIPEERIYVRVEDTVAITANGVENHTALSPLELDDVEALMRRGPGMVQAFPPVPYAQRARPGIRNHPPPASP